MEKEPNTICSQQGFVHAWEDITSNIVYLTNPPQYPPKKERCKNCGLIKTYYVKTETRIEFDLTDIKS